MLEHQTGEAHHRKVAANGQPPLDTGNRHDAAILICFEYAQEVLGRDRVFAGSA
jgi:hypothetical protein